MSDKDAFDVTTADGLDRILRTADGYWPVARDMILEALATHDRQVRVEAWDEGAIFALRDQGHDVTVYTRDALDAANPYLGGSDV